jgi:hypothetical protein
VEPEGCEVVLFVIVIMWLEFFCLMLDKAVLLVVVCARSLQPLKPAGTKTETYAASVGCCCAKSFFGNNF